MLSISNAGQYQSLANGLLSGFEQQIKSLKAYTNMLIQLINLMKTHILCIY